MTQEHELLTTKQAADYLSISVTWLNRDRAKKVPDVKFVKVGGTLVRYRKSDLIAYVKALNKT